ncbi:MAG: NF038122 family metalloprotease [Cyanobacteria bacterium J06643_13]
MNDFGLDSGTQFDFTYAPGTSTEQIIGFEMAGQVWSSYLDDDITVRIYVESTDQLPEDVVGAALPAKKKKADLNNLRKKLVDDATSSDDAAALLNLPSLDNEFSIVVDGRELEKTKDVRFTNANAKALDLLNDEPDKLDGYILVNDLTGQSTAGWNYDASRITSNGGVDFLSVAMHEIGHVLGFVSGIDDDGWLEVLTKAEREEKELKDDAFKFASPLDLFRYSDNDLAAGKIDLSTGGNPYFSIDGGETNLASFSSGEYTDRGGDGYQASHWQNGSGLGIMNPILRAGEIKDISSLDLKAMDVIGWDINDSSSDWQQMYNDALLESESAIVLQDAKEIKEMEKDLEKMIKDSEYEGRRARSSRKSTSSYAWQYGFWQFTTLEDVATSEIPELVESVLETEPTSQSSDTIEEEQTNSLNDDAESGAIVGVTTAFETEFTEFAIPQPTSPSEEIAADETEQEESLIFSNLNDSSSSSVTELTESAVDNGDDGLQTNDISGIEFASSDEGQLDLLLSGGLISGF